MLRNRKWRFFSPSYFDHSNGDSSEMALMAFSTLKVNTPYKITKWPIHYIRKIMSNRTLLKSIIRMYTPKYPLSVV